MSCKNLESKSKVRICRYCRQEFTKEAKPESRTYYCSRECMWNFRHPRKGHGMVPEAPTKPLVTCTVCGKGFLKHHRALCCSEACRIEYRKAARKVYLTKKKEG